MKFTSLVILALAPLVLCAGEGAQTQPKVPFQDLKNLGLPAGFKIPTEVPEDIPISTLDAAIAGDPAKLAQATVGILIKSPKPASPIPAGADKLRKTMSDYNRQSYCPNQLGSDPAWTSVVHLEKQNPLGYHVVALDDTRKNIVVAFRGSMNLEVRGNLMMFTLTEPDEYRGAALKFKDNKRISVHNGAWIGYQTIRKALLERVGKLLKEKPGYSLAITGYSYGAPLAVFAATDFRLKFKEANTNVVTFGGPRPGNAGYSQLLNSLFNQQADWNAPKNTYLRVSRFRDPYPLIPPPTLAFVHGAGQEVFINDEDKFLFCDSQAGLEDPNCSPSILKENLINPGDGLAKESAHHLYWVYMTCNAGEAYEEEDMKVSPESKKALEKKVFMQFVSTLNLKSLDPVKELLGSRIPKTPKTERGGKTSAGANEWP